MESRDLSLSEEEGGGKQPPWLGRRNGGQQTNNFKKTSQNFKYQVKMPLAHPQNAPQMAA
jgi:hypothetical protein